MTSQYGDPVTLTATVAPTSATGTVVFSNGSTVVGTATVSGGTATLTGSSLSAGTKTITTSYQGDANHAASTSSPVTAIVTPRTGPDGGAALTVTVTNASRQYGQGNPAFSYTVTGTLVNGDTYATAVTGVPVYLDDRNGDLAGGNLSDIDYRRFEFGQLLDRFRERHADGKQGNSLGDGGLLTESIDACGISDVHRDALRRRQRNGDLHGWNNGVGHWDSVQRHGEFLDLDAIGRNALDHGGV